MNRATNVLLAVVVGLTLAWGASALLKRALEPAEMQSCRAGRLVFTKALPESVAKSIHDECLEYYRREDIMRRAPADRRWEFVAVRLAGDFADPITIAMAAAFGWIVYRLGRSLRRPLRTRQ